jgi:hypothetical protein
MKRSKETHQESIPVFYWQQREMREALEQINQQHLQERQTTINYGE